MNTTRSIPHRLVVLALALAALAAAGAAALALAGGKASPAPAATRSVQAEIMLNAERAHWRPGKAGAGTLVLDELDPRMAVMAIAPRKESVVVPASLSPPTGRRCSAGTATRRT